MNLSAGAWLAAAAGCATGAIDAWLRRSPPTRASVVASIIAGAVIGAASYGGFVAAGLVISLLTFSGKPDPVPALLCVLLGCAAFLVLRRLLSLMAVRFGMPPRPADGRRGPNDLLDARPRGGPVTMWLAGVGLPLLPVLYGLRCLLMLEGDLGRRLFWPSRVEGGAAVALGLGWIGVGLFLHFHFFFGLQPGRVGASRRGKSIALILACTGLVVAGAWSAIARFPR